MSTFVQITGSTARGLEAELLFDGEIRSTGSGLVGRELLVDLTSAGTISQLLHYPRSIEPTLTLFVRLICAAPPRAFLADPFAEGMVLTLNLRPKQNLLLATDVLHLARCRDGMSIHLLSPVCIAAGHRIPTNHPLTIAAAIYRALRNALGWRRLIPLMPPPLTRVPIRRSTQSGAYVQLNDVPPIPRRRFQKAFGIGPAAEQADAVLWSAFLESLRPNLPD